MDLNQISIPAFDMQASINFYRKLGLKLIVLNLPHYARFEMPSGSTTLSLNWMQDAGANPTELFFEVDDIQARYDQLLAQGISFESKPHLEGWLWTEAKFKDPAGNQLILMHAGQNRRFPPWRLEQS